MPVYMYVSDHSQMSPEDLFRSKEISQAYKCIHIQRLSTANPMGRESYGILRYKGVEHLLNKEMSMSVRDSHAS